MKIVWSPLAVDRASEIAEYIAQDKPSAAEKWVDTVFSRVEQLIASPAFGRIVPEMSNDPFRELIYKNYRIIYRIEKNQICILTIRHGRRVLPIEKSWRNHGLHCDGMKPPHVKPMVDLV